eukprot:6183442-Pleurochrysis_carterae.AAC.2
MRLGHNKSRALSCSSPCAVRVLTILAVQSEMPMALQRACVLNGHVVQAETLHQQDTALALCGDRRVRHPCIELLRDVAQRQRRARAGAVL